MKNFGLLKFGELTPPPSEFIRSARPLRSLAERRSGVLPTSVRLRWRSAELPLERNVPRFKSYRFLAPPIPLNSAVSRQENSQKNYQCTGN